MRTPALRRLAPLALAAACAAPALAQADPATPAEQPPAQPAAQPAAPGAPAATRSLVLPREAPEVFERYVNALGGEDLVRSVTSRHITGTWEGRPFTNITQLELWAEAPDRMHMLVQDPLGGRIEIGFDGTNGWERYNDQPAANMAGDRLVQLRESSDFYGEANYKDRYAETRIVGPTDFNGRTALAVFAKSVGGRDRQLLFDTQTWLLLAERTVLSVDNAGNPTILEVQLSDYEPMGEDGPLYPRTQRQIVLNREDIPQTVIRFTALEPNAVTDHDFSRPAAPAPAAPAAAGN
jgi:hypothetical protein